MSARPDETKAQVLRPMRFGGERRRALFIEPGDMHAGDRLRLAVEGGAALAYAFADAGEADARFAELGLESLGALPLLVRPLRLSNRGLLAKVPLVAPFGRSRRTGFREIAVKEPRITRLWDRFSIDVGVAVERAASWFEGRVFDRLSERGYRVFIFEDGDRYAIRAMCIFKVQEEAAGRFGYVMELLHDRSVTGLRAASHLLGLSLREMVDAGAEAARCLSFGHSGSYPIYARHAFLSARADMQLGVSALDPALEDLVTARDRWYLSYLDLESL